MNSDFITKRKRESEEEPADEKMYACEYTQCPHSNTGMGFNGRILRDNHQNDCLYRFSSSERLGAPTMHNVPTSIDVSGLGIPDDGQKILSELMSFYDGNLHHGRTFHSGNLHNVQGQIQHHPASKFQQDDDFLTQARS